MGGHPLRGPPATGRADGTNLRAGDMPAPLSVRPRTGRAGEGAAHREISTGDYRGARPVRRGRLIDDAASLAVGVQPA